ncbi:MAG: phosphoribosyl-ATP diphosphatase [Planctomycetota bacterium]
MTESTGVLERLMAVIHERQAALPENSYTAQLLRGGSIRIGQKVIEEATEVVEAAEQVEPARIVDEAAAATGQGRANEHEATTGSRGRVVGESADLLYHLMVLWAYCGVSLADVEAELARRFGTSGLDEKRSRGQGQ